MKIVNLMKIENWKLRIPKNSGFTLIELIISIAIVSILSSIVLVNVSRNSDRDARLEKDRFVTFLRSIQNKALAGDKVSDADKGTGQKVCGFGAHYDDNGGGKNLARVYFVTALFDTDCGNVSKDYVPGNDLSNENFYLGHEMTFDSSFTDIFFMIPAASTYLNDSLIGSDTEIYIQTADGITVRIPVTIHTGGFID